MADNKTYIKGNAVDNATSYELAEKNADGTYTTITTKNVIDFEISALSLEAGDHTLVVKAKADGYEDSDYSNEVVYTQPDKDVVITTFDADKFTRGTLVYSSGTLVTSKTHRVVHEDIQYTGSTINFNSLDDGFKFDLQFYTDAEGTVGTRQTYTTSNITGTNIPAGSYYRIHIMRTTEDATEVADIATFVNAIKIIV